MVTTWQNMVQNTVLEVIVEIAHYKGSFWETNVWPRHIESTCRRRHPIDVSVSSSIQYFMKQNQMNCDDSVLKLGFSREIIAFSWLPEPPVQKCRPTSHHSTLHVLQVILAGNTSNIAILHVLCFHCQICKHVVYHMSVKYRDKGFDKLQALRGMKLYAC